MDICFYSSFTVHEGTGVEGRQGTAVISCGSYIPVKLNARHLGTGIC